MERKTFSYNEKFENQAPRQYDDAILGGEGPIVKVLERQVISVFQEEEGIGHTKIGGLASTVTTLLVPLRQPCSLQFQELYM